MNATSLCHVKLLSVIFIKCFSLYFWKIPWYKILFEDEQSHFYSLQSRKPPICCLHASFKIFSRYWLELEDTQTPNICIGSAKTESVHRLSRHLEMSHRQAMLKGLKGIKLGNLLLWGRAHHFAPPLTVSPSFTVATELKHGSFMSRLHSLFNIYCIWKIYII